MGHCPSILLYSSNQELWFLTSIKQAKFPNIEMTVEMTVERSPTTKIHREMVQEHVTLHLLLFFQVIRVGGKCMHRQTRSYQGDLIQRVQDIILIGLSSISHAHKVSVSSYQTLLYSEIISLAEERRHLKEKKNAPHKPWESDSLSDNY